VNFEFPLPLDGQLGFALYGAFMTVGRTYKLWLDQIGLTYPQYLVLSVLWECDDQTVSAIASRLDLEPSTITPLVKRLEQAGHILRKRNPEDERQVKVILTAEGRAIRAKTRTLAEALYTKAGKAGMTVDDLSRPQYQGQSAAGRFSDPIEQRGRRR
jgi:DNA-binding MarR family transcriptional regulator